MGGGGFAPPDVHRTGAGSFELAPCTGVSECPRPGALNRMNEGGTGATYPLSRLTAFGGGCWFMHQGSGEGGRRTFRSIPLRRNEQRNATVGGPAG
jgi:hypothetical protein